MRDHDPSDPSRVYDKTYRKGARPGDRVVRVVPTYKGKFTRQGRHLVATEESSQSATTGGRIAAGVEALGSAFPGINDWRVLVGLAAIALLTIGNLRGIRESGNIFALPTYVFIVSLAGLIAFGIYRQVTGTLPPYVAPPQFLSDAAEPLGILLILRAFSSGAVALTGVEAISNGVPAFKPPEARNARVTMSAMGLLLGALFLGVSYLVTHIGILPDPSEQESVISQLSRALVGGDSPYYFVLQIATALILEARRGKSAKLVFAASTPSPQPARDAAQADPLLPPEHDGHRRAVPLRPRLGRRDYAGGTVSRNRYPTPRSVSIQRGASASSPSCSRKFFTCVSTVRVSPA